MWHLLLYPIRKLRLRKVLCSYICDTVLNESTYFVYMDMQGHYGPTYAFSQLKQAVYDMLLDSYTRKHLRRQFYNEQVPRLIDDWFAKMTCQGSYVYKPGRDKHVFHVNNAVPAKRIFLLVGDTLLNQLDTTPVERLELSNMLFDIIGKKGDDRIKALIFADGKRIVNLFTLKTTGTRPSYDRPNTV